VPDEAGDGAGDLRVAALVAGAHPVPGEVPEGVAPGHALLEARALGEVHQLLGGVVVLAAGLRQIGGALVAGDAVVAAAGDLAGVGGAAVAGALEEPAGGGQGGEGEEEDGAADHGSGAYTETARGVAITRRRRPPPRRGGLRGGAGRAWRRRTARAG